jgi:uncharacterized protein (DUF983 family)
MDMEYQSAKQRFGAFIRPSQEVEECPYCGSWIIFSGANTCKVFCQNCQRRIDCGDNTQLI